MCRGYRQRIVQKMLIKNEFESKACQSDIFRIANFENRHQLKQALDACQSHIITKIDDSKGDLINFLIAQGFRFSVSTLLFESGLEDSHEISNDVFVELAEKDLHTLYAISNEAFSSNNRYSNDEFLKDSNQEIHRKWIQNSVNGYADYSFGYIDNGLIAGFGTLHLHKDHTSIGLLATNLQHRRSGIASRIISYLKQVSLTEGRNRIISATESCNCSAINTYLKNKFFIYRSEISLYRLAR